MLGNIKSNRYIKKEHFFHIKIFLCDDSMKLGIVFA